MTREEANALLNAARDGAEVGYQQIRAALVVTGDLKSEDERDAVVIRRPAGTWEHKGAAAVLSPATWHEVIG